MREQIAVFGASGHTGRFVAAELRRRGFSPVLIGRDAERIRTWPALREAEIRVASVGDPASLDRALRGTRAVINCAGPFLDTAAPLIEAALRARIHYLDVSAEQATTLAVFEQFDERARQSGVLIVPSAAFYGGLADLLATAAMNGQLGSTARSASAPWSAVEEICVAIALDSWQPTPGTRLTGKRNTARRFVINGGQRVLLPDPLPTTRWNFPPPFGDQAVLALPFSEIVTLSRHLAAQEIHSVINLAPLQQLRDLSTPPPVASDETGRSAQVFLVDVRVRRGNEERQAVARGRDIYASTAPIIVEALERILDGRARLMRGAASMGELFDAHDFLRALQPELLAELHCFSSWQT